MPDRCWRKLSATRSADSTARASPLMCISTVLAATLSPSRACGLISMSGESLRKQAATSGRPGNGAGLARHQHGAARRAGRDGGDRGDVAGAAEILGERPRHRVLDLQRRDEAAGVEQGLFDQAFGRARQHGSAFTTSCRSCARPRGGPARRPRDNREQHTSEHPACSRRPVSLSSLRANHIALRPRASPVLLRRPSHAAMRRANRIHHEVSLWPAGSSD